MPVEIKTAAELEGRDCTPAIKVFYYVFKTGGEAVVTR